MPQVAARPAGRTPAASSASSEEPSNLAVGGVLGLALAVGAGVLLNLNAAPSSTSTSSAPRELSREEQLEVALKLATKNEVRLVTGVEGRWGPG